MTATGAASRTIISKGRRYSSRSVRSSMTALTVLRSCSWSLATKCLTVAPTPFDCTPVTKAVPRTPVRSGILRVALEVAAAARHAVQVDGRREEQVSGLRQHLLGDGGTDLGDEVGVPRGAEGAAAREARRSHLAVGLTPRPVRPVGRLQCGDAQPRHGVVAPAVGAGDEAQLLDHRQLRDERVDARRRPGVCHRSPTVGSGRRLTPRDGRREDRTHVRLACRSERHRRAARPGAVVVAA